MAAVRLVCAECQGQGIVLCDGGRLDFCECAAGDQAEALAEQTRAIRARQQDCPACGGDGQIYSQNKPHPDGPCKRCGGLGTVTR
jgi:DnaJ-class molecular chaperone